MAKLTQNTVTEPIWPVNPGLNWSIQTSQQKKQQEQQRKKVLHVDKNIYDNGTLNNKMLAIFE